MLEYVIILTTFMAPGILLFLYLKWISKRFAPTRDQLDDQTAQPSCSHFAETDLFLAGNPQPDQRDAQVATRKDKELAR